MHIKVLICGRVSPIGVNFDLFSLWSFIIMLRLFPLTSSADGIYLPNHAEHE